MALQALSKRAEINAAFETFKRALTRGARPVKRQVGFQGGGGSLSVYWLPKEQFWCALEPTFASNRYWCAFGRENPSDTPSLSITCEINSPYSGVDRRVAGAFAQDAGGRLSIVHSGKIGGGRKGIGQTAFLAHCRCENVPVVFADGRTSEMLLVAALDSSKLRAEIGYFVREVDRVKTLLVKGLGVLPAQDKFTPEFSGKKQPYLPDTPVESVATHGLVVGELAALLEAAGRTPHNDRNRDLYLGTGEQPTHMFEIKTDLTTTSIYSGVGQLMLHGGAANSLRRVLVLPGMPSKSLAEKLASLDIDLLQYSWKGDQPVVKGLKELL